MRTKIIAGNWKMNVKPSETAALVKAVAEATAQYADKVEIVCCTPAIDVPAAVAAAAGTKVGVGTENCHWETSAAPLRHVPWHYTDGLSITAALSTRLVACPQPAPTSRRATTTRVRY